jgi:hypothetical protein
MHAGVEFTLAAVVGLAVGGLLGGAMWGGDAGRPAAAPSVAAPSTVSAPPPVSAPLPVAAPAPTTASEDCSEGPDPDAPLRERLAEVEQLWAFELARLERREGRTLPWPDDAGSAPDAVEATLMAWSEAQGLALEALDCTEYPCIAWVAAPGEGEASRQALEAALTDAPGSRMTSLPLRDGRFSSTMNFGTSDAHRDRRTRWRERSLRGTE